MADVYRAGVVPLQVVAAKKPGHWIVRAMSSFTDLTTLQRCVQQIVGTLDPDIEWTGHRYEGWPGYVVYGTGDLPRLPWASGVYRFDHKAGDPEKGTDMYGPAQWVGDVR